ncbi:DALR domain-containing protein, partial [Flavobacterium sp.]|uniref:DALR domain-containing protein n=1 Tax=Flavobacterium sp. TaxID=239 RepID=UPI002D0C70DF
QGKASTGKEPVKYWMHTNMLTMNGQRMSKSTGNYILPMELINGENTFFEKAFNPNIVRFCFLQAHYRSVLDISNDAMIASEKGYIRLMEAVSNLNNIAPQNTSSIDIVSWKKSCYDAMNDDFNTPIVIAQLFESVRFVNLLLDKKETISTIDLEDLKATLNIFLFDILGLKNETISANNSEKLSGVIEMLIGMRNEARANKNFALSDQIRDNLMELGIQLKDGKEGTSFSL